MAAEQEVARLRAVVYSSHARAGLLAAGLDGYSWDRHAALTFLWLFPDDVPELLGTLVDLSLSDAWAVDCRLAVEAAWPNIDRARFREVVLNLLEDGDEMDYRRLSELLVHVGALDVLGVVLERAGRSADAGTREVADEFRDELLGR